MTPRLSLGAAKRLKRNNDFVYTRRNGRTYRSQYFALFSTIRSGNCADFSSARIGISASRRVGNAVVRNKLKRRFREIFRNRQSEIRQEADLVLSLRPPAANASMAELEQRFIHAIQYNGLHRPKTPPSS